MSLVRNPKDVLSGLLFIALAALFAWQGLELPFGTSGRMGPGYFPMVLSGTLGLLGLIVLVNGLRTQGEAPSSIAWRALIILIGSIVFFGFAMRPLGFLPALAISVFASTLASQKFRLQSAIINTVVMTVFCWAVFIKGLGLPLQIIGPWLGGY
ncbi:tripartite tricarboxylate transporter TctB family protein [Xanthobacter tagetidis]|uniref:Tripartite tricarboxylate transporter TctB family protein n=1 Tax=Xanthobacter tagetidis TaxID=60216 RepID=A0A3L7A325_9HYPH|nr:tripartite tricarboxylate transporter TctB family protein [Xanthobacter tagetidis]MBB6309879.1 putative tricarboxylic transport membrane protein [Xanthobacter tagetidis]RLP74597.1 tripartite tricarboxylate transporter TctB family protein [Xanthobacter tagetidis]